jgi:glycosyltransferase involved in cell wall biosynthesis
LTLVGGVTVHLYRRALETLANELGVADAVEFTDRISGSELVARYRTADVFVCLSEHEGVGAPVLEAMHLDVPVVALAAAALPETVGDAGILLPNKDPAMVAEAVHRVLSDERLRNRMLEAGHERVAHFGAERAAKVRTGILTGVVEGTRDGA